MSSEFINFFIFIKKRAGKKIPPFIIFFIYLYFLCSFILSENAHASVKFKKTNIVLYVFLKIYSRIINNI